MEMEANIKELSLQRMSDQNIFRKLLVGSAFLGSFHLVGAVPYCR
jgi:hypothetical protein